MSGNPELWKSDDDEEPHWLIVSGAPPLSGASAMAIVELLWAMADTIDSEYAAEIADCRRRGRSEPLSWSSPIEEQHLLLDLGDNDYF